MGEGSQVKFDLLGETISLRVEDGEAEVIKVAERLRKATEEIRNQYPALNAKQIALYAALNITEELLSLEKQYKDMAEILDRNNK